MSESVELVVVRKSTVTDEVKVSRWTAVKSSIDSSAAIRGDEPGMDAQTVFFEHPNAGLYEGFITADNMFAGEPMFGSIVGCKSGARCVFSLKDGEVFA